MTGRANRSESGGPPKGLRETPQPHYHGHRDRLRQRFDEAGADALQDYEVLEMLLYRFIPRVDTKPVAKALIARFGSLSGVFGAPVRELMQIDRVGSAAARDLRAVGVLHTRSLKEKVVQSGPLLSSWTAVIDYCNAHLAHESVEEFHVLYLDKKNRLKVDDRQQVGTVDYTPVFPRQVVRKALELESTAMILVHNHPSGDPTPSQADIDMTKTIIATAAPLGIVVHDHIIIGKAGHASMKALQLI